MRRETLLVGMNLIGVAATQGDLGLSSPDRIRAGAHADSVLWERLQSTTASIRMPTGTTVPDPHAVPLVRDWIDFDLLVIDSDEDGVPDASDRCPSVPDATQLDGDGDGTGDACDPDAAPDLLAAAVGPAQAALGSAVAVQAVLQNSGASIATPSQARLFLSADLSFDPLDDPLVGACQVGALGPGGQLTCAAPNARVPADLAVLQPGETAPFHWAACADAYDLVFEGDEANNCAVDAAVVLVPEPRAALQHLIVIATLLTIRRAARCSGRGPFTRRRGPES